MFKFIQVARGSVQQEPATQGRNLTTLPKGSRSGSRPGPGLDPGRQSRSPSRLSALLLAGAVLLAPGWGVQRSLAGVGFPGSPTEDNTPSIAVFQLIVDPAFTFLFGPNPTFYYPGYSPGSAVLTSPTLYDFSQTTIGLSASHVRDTNAPTYFPATVGTLMTPPLATVSGYSDFALIPPDFANAPSGPPGTGVDEIFTEIESFALQCSAGTVQCVPDPRVPTPNTTITMVYAGPDQITGLPLNRRSLGMVQQLTAGPPAASDFPAQSFFDIYVEVRLPVVPGNNSIDFPPGGAILYNDASNPLIIVNTNVTELPPSVVYIHGQTTAVPMRFKTANPPYWAADDVIGYLTLAGHGVTQGKDQSNQCAQVTALLDKTLGPIGASQPQMPVPWLRTNVDFPTPGSGYDSLVNRPDNTTTALDDVVTFTLPGPTTILVRDLSLGGLSSPISPPLPGSTAFYTQPGSFTAFEYSDDGLTWTPGFGSGTAACSISNPIGNTGNPDVYDTEMLQLDITGAGLWLRESPTKQSLGRHTIGTDPRGHRISSFFDVWLEMSFDGLDWFPADRSIRLAVGAPPAAPNTIFLSHDGPSVVLNWQNEFTLQSATDVGGPYQDVTTPVGTPITKGPYAPPLTADQMFFRLRQ
jgi:hypothetical protein